MLRMRSSLLRTNRWVAAEEVTGVFEVVGLPRLQDPDVMSLMALLGRATARGRSSVANLRYPTPAAEAAAARAHLAACVDGGEGGV